MVKFLKELFKKKSKEIEVNKHNDFLTKEYELGRTLEVLRKDDIRKKE